MRILRYKEFSVLKNHISNLEKELIEKNPIMNFLLKQKNEANTNTSSIKKTDIENDEKLETERGNSNKKTETQTEPSCKKKKNVDGISEKGLCVNHKVKIVNFSGEQVKRF